MFEIERGIPIPKIKRKEIYKYPLPVLKPGESFFVPCDTPKKCNSIQTSVRQTWKKQGLGGCGFELISRRVNGGVRFWKRRERKEKTNEKNL